jgi:sulfonate transport system substrate-binding protein
LVNLTASSGGSGGGITALEVSLLERGGLHITSRMAYAALQQRANGLDAVVIWQGDNPNPRRAVIIVAEDSPIHSLRDLKGKSFGASLINCPYYAGREALRAEGLDVDTELEKGDIRFVNVTSSASTAAFLAGRIDAYGVHPGIPSIAQLYVQNRVREIATAVTNGVYVHAGGRAMYFAMRPWARENPELVRAFLKAWDRTVRWLNADHGSHFEEAAEIASRELREPKAVALYDLKDESRISWSWGQTNYADAVNSVKVFQDYAISIKDPFYTRHHLTDREIEEFIDRRFFAGGEYFVDTSEHAATGSQAARAGGEQFAGAAAGERR